MKSGITFIDAQERNRQKPGTYPAPNDAQLKKLWKHDSVRIGVESYRDHGNDRKVVGDERFWAKVKEVRGQEFEGVISTDPLFTDQHGLQHGDTIIFEPRHVVEAHIYDCPQCKHRDWMGYDIPGDELTPAIAPLLCPNCRAELPFDKLGCPISHEKFVALCEHVEDGLEELSCDHSLHLADEFCRREGLSAESVLNWLIKHSGHCDCEVVLNVASRWSE